MDGDDEVRNWNDETLAQYPVRTIYLFFFLHYS